MEHCPAIDLTNTDQALPVHPDRLSDSEDLRDHVRDPLLRSDLRLSVR